MLDVPLLVLSSLLAQEPYQVRYVANLNLGDSEIRITNTGARGAQLLAGGTSANTVGTLCANVYAFGADEQMLACCSCPVTPNGLMVLSVRADILPNLLTPGNPNSLVVKLLASVPAANGSGCQNSAATVTADQLSPGMVAWTTTLHKSPVVGNAESNDPQLKATVTETEFQPATLSTAGRGANGDIGELARLTRLCSFIQANGSGFGVCRTCRLGALGAALTARTPER